MFEQEIVNVKVLTPILFNGKHKSIGDIIELVYKSADYRYLVNTKTVELIHTQETKQDEIVAELNRETLVVKKARNK